MHIVRHEDYIPKEYLPTFSSHPIELNIHRIAGLADHFVYFNDDVFLTAPVTPDDFFQNGLPRDTCRFSVVHPRSASDVFAHILLNNAGVLNAPCGLSHVPQAARPQVVQPQKWPAELPALAGAEPSALFHRLCLPAHRRSLRKAHL